MASPQESITTVSGRRCTRSRARTATTSTSISTPAAAPTPVVPAEPATSTITEQTSQTQSTAVSPPVSQPAPPPPPPPPPPSASLVSSSPVDQSVVVPLPTSQAAVSSVIGTGSAILIPVATSSSLAVLEPSAPASTISTSDVPLQSSEPAVVSSQAAAVPTIPPARIVPTSSDIIETVVLSSSSSSTTVALAQPILTEPAGASGPTSIAATSDISQSATSSQTSLIATSIAELLPQTGSAATGNPTHGPVGIIAPEQGSHSDGDGHSNGGHSSHSGSYPNIGGIVGGVVGGFVGLALLSALLFFCLRKRKSREAEWNEKGEEPSGFTAMLKAAPAGFGVFFAKLRNEKAGPLENPYQRHIPRSSIGSVYSTTSNVRARSISEPQSQSAAGGGFVRRMSSRKSERNVLRKKTSSVSLQSPFMSRNNSGIDPFADPTPVLPRYLRIANPDTTEEQSRGPTPPQPAVIPFAARGPFASLIDEIDGAPNRLRDSNMTTSSTSNHRRTQSTASQLQSHPTSSVYSNNPFSDPPTIPPIPTQASTAHQPRPPRNTYSTFSAARESNYTFFGEPGPSRPGTNMFTPGLPSRPATNAFMTPLPTNTSRLDRQSDPFDLDRPEVLSFKGIMSQMRDSIARQTTTRSRRTSSVGNWFGRDASPSGALNGASVRR